MTRKHLFFALLCQHLLHCAASAEDGCVAEQAPKRFSGIQLNVFGINWGQVWVEAGIREWENKTGGQIHLDLVASTADLERDITSDLATGTNFYDAYICTNKMVPQWASQGWLADLTDAVRSKPELGWGDVLPVFRKTVAVYGGRVVTVPWDGNIFLTYFRRDLAERDGWSAPKTWEEFVAIAQMYDGMDLNEDGVPDYGACLCSDRTSSSDFYHWMTPMLTMVQAQGPRQGAFLNLTDQGVEPLVDNAAFRRAIQILRAAQGSYPVGTNSYVDARADFANGRCALFYTWPSGGTYSIKKDTDGSYVYMHGRMGTANIPGSTQVLDWSSGELVRCTPQLCPYAVDPASGAYDGINRIAWYANGGVGAIVNEATAPDRQEAVLDFLMSYAATIDTTVPGPYNPFRRNHFDKNDYIASGWDEQDAEGYISAEQETLELDNAVLDFRVPFVNEFFRAYSDLYVNLLIGSPDVVELTISQIEANVTSFINRFGMMVSNPKLPGKLELERIYRQSLGLAVRQIIYMCKKGEGYVETDAELGTGTCLKCSPGKYGPGGANQVCLTCIAGTASEESGQPMCRSCLAGTYAPAGSSTCSPCPVGTAPGSMGQEVCPCDKGWWGTGGNCTKCPEPMTTKLLAAPDASQCVCPEGMYRPASSAGPENCLPCNEGLDCAVGSDAANFPDSTSARVTERGGAYPRLIPKYYSQQSDPFSVFMCLSDKACPGGPPGSCAAHTVGLACASCQEGFDVSTEGCQPCEGFFRVPGLALFVPLLVAPLAVISLYRLSGDDMERWGGPSLGVAGSLALGLAFLQSLAVAKTTIDTSSKSTFSSPMLKSWDFAKYSVQLSRIVRPACAFGNDFMFHFILQTMIPVVVAVVVLITFLFSRFSSPLAMDRDVTWTVYGSIFDVCYIAIAAQSMSLFQCYSHPNGKSSLRTAAEVLCYEDVWWELVVVAISAILVFCVFSVALYAFVIHRAPRQIESRGFRMRWKFILKRFRPSRYWWALVILAKGLWVNLAAVITTDSAMVFILRFFGFLVYFACTTLFNPWRKREITYLDVFVHALLLLILCFLELLITISDFEVILNIGSCFVYIGEGVCVLAGLYSLHRCLRPGGASDRPNLDSLAAELSAAPWLDADPTLIRRVLGHTDVDVAQSLRKFNEAAAVITALGGRTSHHDVSVAMARNNADAAEKRVRLTVVRATRRASQEAATRRATLAAASRRAAEEAGRRRGGSSFFASSTRQPQQTESVEEDMQCTNTMEAEDWDWEEQGLKCSGAHSVEESL